MSSIFIWGYYGTQYWGVLGNNFYSLLGLGVVWGNSRPSRTRTSSRNQMKSRGVRNIHMSLASWYVKAAAPALHSMIIFSVVLLLLRKGVWGFAWFMF